MSDPAFDRALMLTLGGLMVLLVLCLSGILMIWR